MAVRVQLEVEEIMNYDKHVTKTTAMSRKLNSKVIFCKDILP